jgi:hypothetical protein
VRVRAKAPHQSFAVAVRGQPMCFGFAVDAFAGARVRRELMIACVVAGWKKYFQKTFGLEIVYPYSFCSLSGGYRKKILRKFVRLRVGSDDISLTALSKGGESIRVQKKVQFLSWTDIPITGGQNACESQFSESDSRR